MNANAFRKRVYANRSRGVDWTDKQRVAFAVLIRLDSIVTDAHRRVVGQVYSYVGAGKCPVTTFDASDTWLLMGHGYTYTGRWESAEIAGYAKIIHRLLRRSGMAYRIKPRAAYHYMPETEEHPLPKTDLDRLDEPDYKALIDAQLKAWEEAGDAHQARLKRYGAYDYWND